MWKPWKTQTPSKEDQKRLLGRNWDPVYTDRSMWSHPELEFHWRTVDALRLEDERDRGDYLAMKLLGDWKDG